MNLPGVLFGQGFVGAPTSSILAGAAPTTPVVEKKGWIQDAEKSIKRRGTKGVCTGKKFGGPTCKPGTKRYALAKNFHQMGKKAAGKKK